MTPSMSSLWHVPGREGTDYLRLRSPGRLNKNLLASGLQCRSFASAPAMQILRAATNAAASMDNLRGTVVAKSNPMECSASQSAELALHRWTIVFDVLGRTCPPVTHRPGHCAAPIERVAPARGAERQPEWPRSNQTATGLSLPPPGQKGLGAAVRATCSVAGLLSCFAFSAANAQTLTKISSAPAFLDSIGVVGSANSTTAAQLSYLGINHLRTDGTATSAQLLAAGATGAKIDVITPIYLGDQAAVTTATLQTFLSTVIDPAASVIESIEGPNEVNVDPDTFNGLPAGPPSMEALQQCLYQLVQADPNLMTANSSVSTYDFSVMVGTPPNMYTGMQDYASSNNVHAYGEPGVQPDVFLAYAQSQITIAGSDPYVLTETGAETMADSGVDEPTQAAYEIDALLDSAQLGFTRTYLFDIQDFEREHDKTDFSGHYGMFKYSGARKLAATTLHNFTTILSMQGGRSLQPLSLPQILPVTFSGQFFYYTNYEYLQKPNGYSVVLWNETYDWNPYTHQPVSIMSNTVTLTLSSQASQIAIYDPMQSSKAITTQPNTSTVSVVLNTHPIIVDVSY